MKLTTTQNEHTSLVRNLCKDGHHILQELSPEKCVLIHMAMGISGEAGELLDSIKKHTIYNKSIDLVNIKEELGDLEFFLEGLRQVLNITRRETLSQNITKLTKRYPSGTYSNTDAINRADKHDS